MEFTLLWAALAAAVGVYGALWWMGRRDATVCVGDLWEMAITAAIAGLVVGRIAAMVRQGVSPLAHPGDLLLVRAGVDTVAASVAALLTAGWMARRNVADLIDALAPAALFGLAGWHAGCVFRDACLGTPSDLPWAWAQSSGGPTRHPVELYAAVLLLIAALLLFRLRLRYPAPYLVAGLSLTAAAAVRLVTEPLRPSLFAGPVWWYAAAMIAGGIVAGWAWRRGASRRASGSLQ